MKPADIYLLSGELAANLAIFVVAARRILCQRRPPNRLGTCRRCRTVQRPLAARARPSNQDNLALVASVLSLQARTKENPEIRSALKKAVARVQAIGSA